MATEGEKMFERGKPREDEPQAHRENRIGKEDLLKRLSERQGDLRLDREALRKDRERLLDEVRSLEDESNALTSRARELQSQLLERRKTAARVCHRSEEMKNRMVQFLAKENNLIHEVRFLESEKDKQIKEYADISGRVNAGMASIAAILRDIEFMRGEMETLMGQSGSLESEVPDRHHDIDRLDEKISSALHSIVDLYDKVKAAEKNAKVIFYCKEKGIERDSS